MKRTYKPSKKSRRSTHGFRKRMKSHYGRETLNRRRRKGRARVSVTAPKKGQSRS